MKALTLTTIITLATLGTTETGWLKLVCWLALFVEFVGFTVHFERILDHENA